MNNHGIICKNNNMIIFLLILIAIILILLNQKIKLDINFSINGLEYYFCVRIIYFFEIVTLYKEDLMKYIKNIKSKNKTINQNSKKFLKMKKIEIPLQYFNVERIHFDLKIGVGDSLITSMIVPILSTFFSITLQRFFPMTLKQFSIMPKYNEFFLSTKGVMKISIKLKDVIYIIFLILLKNIKK